MPFVPLCQCHWQRAQARHGGGFPQVSRRYSVRDYVQTEDAFWPAITMPNRARLLRYGGRFPVNIMGRLIRAVIGLVPCQDFKQEGRRGDGSTDVRSGASLGSLENRRPVIQVHAWPS